MTRKLAIAVVLAVGLECSNSPAQTLETHRFKFFIDPALAKWRTIFDAQSQKMISASITHEIEMRVATTPITPIGYDQWKSDNLLTAGGAARRDDPDNDGLNNFAEYAFGLNPNQADSPGAITLTHCLDSQPNGGVDVFRIQAGGRRELQGRVLRGAKQPGLDSPAHQLHRQNRRS